MKSVIIFGGSGLIGSQVTKFLLEKSYQVINFDIKENKKRIPNLIYKRFDLSSINSVQDLYEIVKNYLPKCCAIINCTLIPYPEFNIESLTKSDLNKACSSLLSLDLFICSMLINYAKTRVEKSFIAVIIISSVKALYPPKFRHYKDIKGMQSSPFYGSMKAASLMLIKHFASEYRDLNITFNAIAPGGIEGENHSSEFIKRYKESTSNVGLIDPSYIALAVNYLIESGLYINGTTITVDAGWSCD